MAAGADEREKEAVGAGVGNRRDVLQRAASLATAAALGGLPQAALAKKGKDGCRNIEECREVGERTSERIEQELGPVVKLGQGVRYREVKPPNPPASAEPVPVVKEGDVCYIKYQVLKGNGDFMWSLGYGKEPGLKDADETYRVKLGRTPLPDVPVAVEMALVGMKPGAVRRVEMPPRVGFESSAWEPAPQTFSGRKKLERFRAVLTGNGLQPGFDAVVLFEVELVSVRPPRGPGKGKGAGGAAPEVDAASAFNRLTQTN